MTRRLHACLTCVQGDPKAERFTWKRGLTRHKDRICSRCRRRGVRIERNGLLYVPIVTVDYRGRGA